MQVQKQQKAFEKAVAKDNKKKVKKGEKKLGTIILHRTVGQKYISKIEEVAIKLEEKEENMTRRVVGKVDKKID